MRKKTKTPLTRNNTSQKARKKAIINKVKEKVKKAKDGYYRGIYYESLQEKYTLAWLFELKDSGLVSNIRRGESLLLSDGVHNNYVHQLKRGSKPMTQTILRGHSYTDDYILTVEGGLGKLFFEMGSEKKHSKELLICQRDEDGKLRCRLEVKPRFNRGSSSSLPKAVNDIKWVFQRHGIFINIFIPEEHFQRTFTPNIYLKTDTGKDRMLKYTPITLKNYL